jgi:hypothetical protein
MDKGLVGEGWQPPEWRGSSGCPSAARSTVPYNLSTGLVINRLAEPHYPDKEDLEESRQPVGC